MVLEVHDQVFLVTLGLFRQVHEQDQFGFIDLRWNLTVIAGIQLEKFKTCEKFAISVRNDQSFLATKLPFYYLSSCMALW